MHVEIGIYEMKLMQQTIFVKVTKFILQCIFCKTQEIIIIRVFRQVPLWRKKKRYSIPPHFLKLPTPDNCAKSYNLPNPSSICIRCAYLHLYLYCVVHTKWECLHTVYMYYLLSGWLV